MRVIRSASLALLGATLLGLTGARPASATRALPTHPHGATALHDGGHDGGHDGATPADVARRAAELHQQSLDAGAAGRYRRAATLMQRSASLHAADDPRGARCLELAANFQYYSGDLAGARQLLETAGDRSLARGDVATAADAYLKAGIVARDAGDRAGESAYTRRAHLLASSPLLSPAQRSDILARIVQR